jgi:DNA-binding MarR family transcriptional regulator
MTDEPVSEESELGDIVELLDDAVIRSILAVTSEEPHSAKELAEYCDVSVSSIYRRVERLEAASLLTEQTRPRADGHHDTVYVARLDRFEVTVENGEIDWTIERESGDIADELSRMWGNF